MIKPFREAIAAALTAAAPLVVMAQAVPAPSASASGPASAAPSIAPAAGTSYTSAFEGYRGFNDQRVLPWRDANDNVGRIGGWRAYARESAGEEKAPAPAADPKHGPHKHGPHKPASMPHDAHHKSPGGHSMSKKPPDR